MSVMDGQELPGTPDEARDESEAVRALERGMAALTERVGRLEDEVLPREVDPEIGMP